MKGYNRLKGFILRRALQFALAKAVKRAFKKLPESEKMEILKSKQQIASILTAVASVAAIFNATEIAQWLTGLSTAVAGGDLNVILTAVVTGVIAVITFLGRLNRKKDMIEAVKAVMSDSAPVPTVPTTCTGGKCK